MSIAGTAKVPITKLIMSKQFLNEILMMYGFGDSVDFCFFPNISRSIIVCLHEFFIRHRMKLRPQVMERKVIWGKHNGL